LDKGLLRPATISGSAGSHPCRIQNCFLSTNRLKMKDLLAMAGWRTSCICNTAENLKFAEV